MGDVLPTSPLVSYFSNVIRDRRELSSYSCPTTKKSKEMVGTGYFSNTVWAVRRTGVLSFGIAAMVALLFGLLTTAGPAYAATTFTVNSTADPGTDGCDATECTLREAITAANANPGTDTIEFDIPGNGPHTISPTSVLPTITEAVTIDGYTQGKSTATGDDDAKENTIPAPPRTAPTRC